VPLNAGRASRTRPRRTGAPPFGTPMRLPPPHLASRAHLLLIVCVFANACAAPAERPIPEILAPSAPLRAVNPAWTIANLDSRQFKGSGAEAINDYGTVGGWGYGTNGVVVPVIWRGLTAPATILGASGKVLDVNNDGAAVGGTPGNPTLWDPAGTPIALSAPAGYYGALAYRINDRYEIVGNAQGPGGVVSIIFWDAARRPRALTTPGSLSFAYPTGINTAGQISAYASSTGTGTTRALYWSSVRSPGVVLPSASTAVANGISERGWIGGWDDNNGTTTAAGVWQSSSAGITTYWKGGDVLGMSPLGRVVGEGPFMALTALSPTTVDTLPQYSGGAQTKDANRCGAIAGVSWLVIGTSLKSFAVTWTKGSCDDK